MTTSGIVQSSRPISELINEAADYCQIAVEEESLSPEDFQRSIEPANFLLRNWQAQGFHLWQYQEAVLFLDIGRPTYPLISDTVRVVRRDLLTGGAVFADAIQGSISLSIEFPGNVVDCDGIEYDITTTDGLVDWIIGIPTGTTIFWTTITSSILNVSENEMALTLTDVLPSDVSAGTATYIYPPESIAPQVRPSVERILDVRRTQNLQTTSEIETPIKFDSHQEFHKLPNRLTQGTPNVATFDRLKTGGCLKVWQTSATETTYQIAFTFERTFEKFVTPADTADFPQYWQDAFVFNLAERLCMKFNVPPEIKADIRAKAKETLNEALSYDNANYDISVVINNRVGS